MREMTIADVIALKPGDKIHRITQAHRDVRYTFIGVHPGKGLQNYIFVESSYGKGERLYFDKSRPHGDVLQNWYCGKYDRIFLGNEIIKGLEAHIDSVKKIYL